MIRDIVRSTHSKAPLPVYYAVVDPAKDVVSIEETSYAQEAISAARGDYDGDGTLDARQATEREQFIHLVEKIDLSYAALARDLGVSDNFVGQRVRGQADVRRMDVLALERLRQLKEEEK